MRPPMMVACALGAIYLMFEPPFGDTVTLAEIGLAVTPLRLDAQSQVFGLCFALLTVIIALFSTYRRDRIEDALLMTVAGAAATGVFVGDFIGFVAAAMLAGFASAGLVMSARGGAGGLGAGVRMLIWQGAAGLLMTAGVGLIWARSRSVDFDIVEAATPGGALLFAGFLIQAGAPGAHVWVKDAVARATPVGAAALAAFPRTLAIYALVRAFPGEPALIPIGAAMALWPLAFAAAARDMRVAMAYGAVSQTGAALIAIGAATPLAVGGAAAYASPARCTGRSVSWRSVWPISAWKKTAVCRASAGWRGQCRSAPRSRSSRGYPRSACRSSPALPA
jgi:multicomponent Na+:H+ antiporter subunit D